MFSCTSASQGGLFGGGFDFFGGVRDQQLFFLKKLHAAGTSWPGSGPPNWRWAFLGPRPTGPNSVSANPRAILEQLKKNKEKKKTLLSQRMQKSTGKMAEKNGRIFGKHGTTSGGKVVSGSPIHPKC